jgi:hypothetical protein
MNREREFNEVSIRYSSGGGKPPKKEKKLFDDIDYKHTARIPSDAWFLRFWAWMWETDIKNANFCTLFWGLLVFMPLNLFIRTICFPFYLIVVGVKKALDGIARRSLRRAANRPEPTKEERQRQTDKEVISALKKERREERIMRFFTFVSGVADRIVGGAKRCWPVVKIIVYGVGGILAAGVAAFLLWATYLLGTLVVANSTSIGNILLIILGLIGVVLVCTGIVFGGFYLILETKAGAAIRRFFDRVFGAVFRTLWIGLCGVKGRTCPKIELIEPEKAK